MLAELLVELTELAVLVMTAYVAIHAYARVGESSLRTFLIKRKTIVLSLLALTVVGAKVSEDVFDRESGAIDEMLMWFINERIPAGAHPFFEGLTMAGSAVVLMPLAAVVALSLLAAKRRAEAALIAASLACSSGLVYVIKSIVDRDRPALWETEQWYWGSSFPSGHTTSTAAFSTALALCVGQIWPRWGKVAMVLALLWTALMGLSRMVLGVHWPSDVLAALCLGVLIALLLRVGLDLYMHHSPPPAHGTPGTN